MKNFLSITSNAADQIKKIMSDAPKGMDSIVLGIDKSGCSGYSYKLDFGNSSDLQDFEIIQQFSCKAKEKSEVCPWRPYKYVIEVA